VFDPHFGSSVTVRIYESEKLEESTGEWKHTRVTLKARNTSYPPIILEVEKEESVRILGEFIGVLPTQYKKVSKFENGKNGRGL
jgi:hypothetical protein